MQALTLDMLLGTFRAYNTAAWPLLVVDYALVIVAAYLALRPRQGAGRIITGVLAFLWLSTSITFSLLFFAPVYPPTYLFIVLFLLQGALFLLAALRAPLSFRLSGSAYGVAGTLMVLYAVFGYPIVENLLGHHYPELALIGAPCPMGVLTFGLLLWSEGRVPRYLLVIPLLWALSGLMPLSIGVWEDIGLITSGVVGTAMLLYRDAKGREPAREAVTARAAK